MNEYVDTHRAKRILIISSICFFVTGILIGYSLASNSESASLYMQYKELVKSCEAELPRNENCQVIVYAIPTPEVEEEKLEIQTILKGVEIK
ncbi:hypothetical protein RVBP17_3780 [Pseudomonas phage sp. 30-3]|uniref:Uncharacterized protein n=1 Tax=Pseudomonas phage vB_PaeM_PA5oct TaxID=2163605 RepID=A0A4Y1LU78_9CAUD|nr:hypothetical protein PQE65_gp413 [Pseudomonas phage vB_PaeM_PA5oct]QCG75952.1 hypothetical protein EST35_0070 [Pseudomonas phage vB_PaeM_PA5oct]WMI32028.1 hypothetical protein GBBBJNDB_00337 [Pseudomonas phage Callisto]BDR26335.1 hypothetical protein RVBP17_3780 [Pseudomonas phage sp. 30-3]